MDQFHVEKLRTTPGIYYEEIGTLHTIKEVWKLAIQLNLSPIQLRESTLETTMTTLKQICNNTQQDTLCSTLSTTMEPMIKSVKNELQTIHDLVGKKKPREKRGLIDGLGSIIKSITGNLDADDAQKIEEKIQQVTNRQATDENILKEN